MSRPRINLPLAALAIVAGIICGIVVYRAGLMSRLTGHFYRRNSFSVRYGCCYPDPRCQGHLLDSVGTVSASEAATRLLCRYADSLDEFSELINVFRRKIPRADLETLLPATRAIFPGIRGVNSAYVNLTMTRYAVTTELARSVDNRGATDLACAMEAVEQFQWDSYRTHLNELLVPLLPIWSGTGGLDSLAAVKSHVDNDTGSSSSWEALATMLRGEARTIVQSIPEGCHHVVGGGSSDAGR